MISKALISNGKQLFFVLTGLMFIMAACSPTEKAINDGQYDQVIHKLSLELKDKPSAKKAEQLQVSYQLANDQDMDAVNRLKNSGQPDIWYEVYWLFDKMENRQQKVAVLPDTVLKQMDFKPVDYRNQLSQSRLKAAEYHYALAKKKMEDGNGNEDPAVYENLARVVKIYPDFRDARAIMTAWKEAQPTHVRMIIMNEFDGTLPPGVAGGLQNINPEMFSTEGFRFVDKKSRTGCGYVAEVTITDIKIKPEKTGELSYTESAKIQDGVAYQLNNEGDFVYDSLGNKIEIPKFNTLVCYVTEYRQEKSILMRGNLKLIDSQTGKIIGSEKLRGESVFTHNYAKFKGDMDALSAETFNLVGTKKRDFPSDSNMILHAGERLCGDASQKAVSMLEKVEL